MTGLVATGAGAGTTGLVTAAGVLTSTGAGAALATGLAGAVWAGAGLAAAGLAVGFAVLAVVWAEGWGEALAVGLALAGWPGLAVAFGAGFLVAGAGFLAAGLVGVGRLTGVLLTEVSSQRRLYPLRGALSCLAAPVGRRGL